MAVNTYAQFTAYNAASPVALSESQLNFTKLPSGLSTAAGTIFEVNSLTFDIEQTLNIGSQSTGAGAGKIAFNPLQISRKIDSFSPVLFQLACSGTPFQTVRIFLTKSTGSSSPGNVFLIYTFKLVAVKEIGFISGDEAPSENVSFEYGALTIEYFKQHPDGSLTSVPTTGWNRVKNVSDPSTTSVVK